MSNKEHAGPQPRSYSQMRLWLDCPKSFQLGNIQKVKGRPGVWFPAGTAVHSTLEQYLLEKAEQEAQNEPE